MVVCERVDPKYDIAVDFFVSNEDSDFDPLYVIPPGFDRETKIFDWVLHKVDKLKDLWESPVKALRNNLELFLWPLRLVNYP